MKSTNNQKYESQQTINNYLKVAVFVFCMLSIPIIANASPITPTANAWSSKLGWVNFAPDTGGVSVTDSALTGYAWSAQSGWINLAPDQSGIKNNGQGVLSGSAWGAGTGWINFSGVTINPSTGLFSGQATGDAIGTLTFNCDQCHVVTTWRPPSSGGGFVIFPPATPPATTTVPASTTTNTTTPSNPSQPTRPTPITADLSATTTNPQVKLLQQFLNTHGFPIALTGPGSLGNETDYFGQATKEALIKFQKANGISPADGILGALTRAKIKEIQDREANTVVLPPNQSTGTSATSIKSTTTPSIIAKSQSILKSIIDFIQSIIAWVISFFKYLWWLLTPIWRK